ncbi:nucleotide exchange factor GrpE [Phreatobacter aquaticus]|uniref:Protein GrpE n=1 Tax=Phreatobacter aquaticus TaxID=2570229 RepID=A0A4D7QHD2_9HYPH|nr:nucleotide exchange factor GrpE [Phreatobacter aquaticus]QCK86708.1 nucleotide exchange factor GrpE [Phreatobacter aquaticus]
MTRPTDSRPNAETDTAPLHDNPTPDSPAVDAPSEEEAGNSLEAELEAARAEARDMKDRVLRTLAEMENLRKRTEREVADAKTYGVTSFARDMLAVADNMRRAFETLPEDARPADGPVKAFLDGIDLTERELIKTLGKHGVKKIEPDGQKFDPNLHQAMFEMPNTEVPNGTVVQTVQAGFVIGDRVLRPALVGVSKGGPKAAPASAASQGA